MSYFIDKSRTDKEDSVNNLKDNNNKNIDDEYKKYNSQHHHSNVSYIKKLKKSKHLLNG